MIGKLLVAGMALSVGGMLLVPVLAVSSMSAESTLASSAATQASCSSSPNVKVTAANLDTAQLLNAEDIMAAASTVPKAGVRGEIVGVAVGLDESDLTNDANNAVPASLAIPHEGLSADHDSVGVFQDRASKGWGTVAQIMDPVFAATEFLTRLVALPGWGPLPAGMSQQQTDTLNGEAAQAVQRSGDPSGGNYAAMVPLATTIVSSAIPVGATLDTCTTPDPALPAKAKLPAAVVAAIRGAPSPVQQAIAYSLAQLGKPYRWGAIGPASYDCSGLVMEAWLSAGVVIPRTSEQQATVGTPISSEAALLPGDVVEPFADHSHVVLYLGAGYVVQAPKTGEFIEVVPFYGMAGGARRIIAA